MFQIRLRRKRKAVSFLAKKLPHSKRIRTVLLKTHFPNSPLAELFCQKAMWLMAYETSVAKAVINVNAKELLGCLEGLVNNNSPKGASEFHYRIRCAWQDEEFFYGVWYTWGEYPDTVEGLSKYSRKCAAEERVADMKQDPAFLHILEAAKSDEDPRDNDYVTLRGLLSILFVYWNDGDDLEKLFIHSKIKKEVGTATYSFDELPLEEAIGKIQIISYMAYGRDDVQDLEKVLNSTHSDDPEYAASKFEQIAKCQRERLSLFGETEREKPTRIQVSYNPWSMQFRSAKQGTNVQ